MQSLGVGAGLAALGFWGFIAAVVVAGIWYGIRDRQSQHETLRRVIESGQPVDRALIDKLLGGGDHVDRDLKIAGLIVLSVAPGLALLGWFISLQSAHWLLPILGAAALVGCVGIGLLAAAKVAGRSRRDNDASAPDR
jgi:hypothetical protein